MQGSIKNRSTKKARRLGRAAARRGVLGRLDSGGGREDKENERFSRAHGNLLGRLMEDGEGYQGYGEGPGDEDYAGYDDFRGFGSYKKLSRAALLGEFLVVLRGFWGVSGVY